MKKVTENYIVDLSKHYGEYLPNARKNTGTK